MMFQAKVVFPIILAIVVVISVILLTINESHVGIFDEEKISLDPICTQLAVQHLLKYSNIAIPYFDGDLTINTVGLPDGLSQNELDDCVDFILSHHDKIIDLGTPSEQNLQWLLVNCACQESDQGCPTTTASYKWENSTHHIDSTDCEWYPNDGYHDTPIIPNVEKSIEHEFELPGEELSKTHPTLSGYKIPEICNTPMIKHLVNYSNMFDGGIDGYVIEEIGLDDFINEKNFDTCEHELLTIFYPTPDGPKPMDDITEYDFTEKCHFIPNTIHANFTDGKVITTTDDCN